MKSTLFYQLALLFCSVIFAQSPINDECSGAIELNVNPGNQCLNVYQGSLENATQSAGGEICSNWNPDRQNDVWYKFKAVSTTHKIEIFNKSDYPEVIVNVYDGGCNGNLIACFGPESTNRVFEPSVGAVSGLQIGEVYFLRVFNMLERFGSKWDPNIEICITSPLEEALRSSCDRAEMVKEYYQEYNSSQVTVSELAWTGNEETCDEGSISEVAQEKTLQRINYFRELVGLQGNVFFDEDKNALAQKGAFLMHKNEDLDHYPDDTWLCITEDAKLAAAKSNLAWGSHSAQSIDQYIDDAGSNNEAVGHRRWIFNSTTNGEWGHGSTDNFNALYVISGSLSELLDIEFIAYPNAGFYPVTLYPRSNRWSFSVPRAVFDNAVVEMFDENGTALVLDIVNTDAGSGDNSIVWEPEGIILDSELDVVYTIKISNIILSDGTVKQYEYETTLATIVYPPVCAEGLEWSENDCGCVESVLTSSAVFKESDIYVYPVPSSTGRFTASFKNYETMDIMVFNSQGTSVKESRLSGVSISIDLSAQPKGIYIVLFTTSKGRTISKKVVIN